MVTIQELILAHARREQMAARIAEFSMRPEVECLYFGCIDRPGHHLHGLVSQGTASYAWLGVRELRLQELFGGIDAKLCWNSSHRHIQDEGRAFITHQGEWTALAFWDRTIDHRPGSNSAFFVQGRLTFSQMIRVIRHCWPKVWARFTFPIVEVDANGREVMQ